jgi:hypothetical protein
MTGVIKRCEVCGSIITDEDEDFQVGKDDPDLCELCQEVAS